MHWGNWLCHFWLFDNILLCIFIKKIVEENSFLIVYCTDNQQLEWKSLDVIGKRLKITCPVEAKDLFWILALPWDLLL